MLEWKRLEGECNVCHTLLLTLPHLTYYTELVSHIMADATRVAVRGTLLELLPVDLQPAPGATTFVTIKQSGLFVFLQSCN